MHIAHRFRLRSVFLLNCGIAESTIHRYSGARGFTFSTGSKVALSSEFLGTLNSKAMWKGCGVFWISQAIFFLRMLQIASL